MNKHVSMGKFFLFYILTAFSLFSCNSTKKIVYFENVKDTTFYSGNNENPTPIEPNDILSISISSLNPEASAMFNPNYNSNARSTTVTGGNTETGGYLVNYDGTIQLPVLGSVKAGGLTKRELKNNITNLI